MESFDHPYRFPELLDTPEPESSLRQSIETDLPTRPNSSFSDGIEEPLQTDPVSDLAGDESDDEEELTVIQYARRQGIALDHLNPERPLQDLCLARQQHETINPASKLIIQEDTDLPTVETLLPPDFNLPRESLSISREAIPLLATFLGRTATTSKEEAAEIEGILSELLDVRKKKSKVEKLELPVLKTDHELDVANWGGRAEPVVEDLNVPREPLDEAKGDGLKWGKETRDAVAKIDERIRRERLVVHAATFKILADVMNAAWDEDDAKKLWDSEVSYKRNTALEPVTPPLAPLSPRKLPFVPSSPLLDLPLLSDPSSLISADLEAAEAEIFKNDTIIDTSFDDLINDPNESSDTVVGDAPNPLLASLDSPTAPPETQLIRASDHKVEVPLTPPRPVVHKTVKFNNIIEEMLLEEERASTQASQNEAEEGEDQKFFQEAFGAISKAVEQRVQQEQLKSADSLARVDVPVIDLTLPTPPWAQMQLKRSATETLALHRAFIRDIIEMVPVIWSGSKKKERDLRWAPFSSELAKVAIDEKIEGDGGLSEILNLTSLEDVADSSTLTWKPEGLRILRQDEDEESEELELGHFSEKQPQDIDSLLRKRRLELEGEPKNRKSSVCSDAAEYRAVERMISPKDNHKGLGGGEPKRRRSRKSKSPNDRPESPYLPKDCEALLTMKHDGPGNPTKLQDRQPKAKATSNVAQQASSNLLHGNIFSAGNALDNFMEIRASKRQKLGDSSYFNAAPKNQPTIAEKPNQTDGVTQRVPAEHFHQPTTQSIPLPNYNLQPVPRNIIISSSILKNRPLINNLTAIIPKLSIIERDFSAHNSTMWQPNTVIRSPIASPLDSEADIIISPTTSIIITSLQAIKQKPLPGSKSKNKVLERLMGVAPRYERVVVFVTGIDEFSAELNADDCLKFSEFIGWCSAHSLSTPSSSSGFVAINSTPSSSTILPSYVPSSPLHIAHHIALAISKYGLSLGPDEALIEDETVWELFLRRAGMNAFAAQTVIGLLKEPEGVDAVGSASGFGGAASGSGSKKGLVGIRAFVEMGGVERMRRFGNLVGRGVIERAGRVVDKCWNEAE